APGYRSQWRLSATRATAAGAVALRISSLIDFLWRKQARDPTRLTRATCLFFESACRSKLRLEHDLFRKPASTFRDHALEPNPESTSVPRFSVAVLHDPLRARHETCASFAEAHHHGPPLGGHLVRARAVDREPMMAEHVPVLGLDADRRRLGQRRAYHALRQI